MIKIKVYENVRITREYELELTDSMLENLMDICKQNLNL